MCVCVWVCVSVGVGGVGGVVGRVSGILQWFALLVYVLVCVCWESGEW